MLSPVAFSFTSHASPTCSSSKHPATGEYSLPPVPILCFYFQALIHPSPVTSPLDAPPHLSLLKGPD